MGRINSENLAPLSVEEKKKMEQALSHNKAYYLIFSLLIVIGLFLIVFDTPYYVRIIFGSLILIFLFFVIGRTSLHKKNIHKDLLFGKKKVISGYITDLKKEYRGKKTDYLASVSSYDFSLSSEEYDSLLPNDLVEVHFGINSRFVLQIKKLEDKTN